MGQAHAAQDISEQIIAIQQYHRCADQAIERLLARARDADPIDRASAAKLLEAAEEIGRAGQARQGQLVLILAQADRVKAHCGGLASWISEHLDLTAGAARSLAQTAREIGHVPELFEALSSGRFGAPTIRTLTRTACAVKDTEADVAQALTNTLSIAASQGVGQAVWHVRFLEKACGVCPRGGMSSEKRIRSFLRLRPTDGGMTRVEALLDPEGATVFRSAVDRIVATWLGDRGKRGESAAEDVGGIEGLQAEALVTFAEAFADMDGASEATRAARFGGRLVPPRATSEPAHEDRAQDLVPYTPEQALPCAATRADRGPAARLIAAARRAGIAWRGETCAYPVCRQPLLWRIAVRQ